MVEGFFCLFFSLFALELPYSKNIGNKNLGELQLGTSILCFYPLRYAAVLLKFTYHAHYYTQEQQLLSDYYDVYLQFCTNNSLNIADNFIETVLLECINERYPIMQ